MDIGQLVEIVRGSLKEEDLVPVKQLKDPKFINKMKKKFILPSYEQIIELANKLEVPVEHFYINLKGLFSPIVYFHDGMFLELPALDDDYIKNFQVKKTLKFNLDFLQKCIQDNDYGKFFIRIDSRIKILMFKRLFNEIPDKDLYEIFIMIYTHADYGFTEIDQKYFSRIIKCKTGKQQQEIEQNLKKKLNKNGFITIYRGVGNKSTPVGKAYSWTTSINTATSFASRFSESGDIYAGEIHIKDVIAYIDSRDEKEILTLPGKVKKIRKMNLLTINEVWGNFPEITDDYIMEIWDIKNDYFLNPDSIHGMLHAKRVLLLTLIIGSYEKLNDSDMEIVLTAAKFHDIGRTDDNYDETHGILSFNKLLQLELVDKDIDDIHILHFIIDNHCINDNQGLKNIDKYQIKDKDRAVYLYNILKDADGLDRVRLNDMDIKYLRLPISKKLPLVAQQIYKNLK